MKKTINIDDYWIQEFLAYAAKRFPNLVIQMLLNRIENYTEDANREYKPLPYEELKYTFNLSEDNNDKDVIRRIRDMSLNKLQTASFWLAILFQGVLASATELSLSVLNEWINSRELEKVQCASSLLGSIPQSFVFTQVDFLSNFLEQADNIGDQCFEFVYHHLINPIVNRLREVTIGEPCKKDIILRDQSLAIASQFLIGSPAHKFYSSLAKCADSNIKRQIELGRSEID